MNSQQKVSEALVAIRSVIKTSGKPYSVLSLLSLPYRQGIIYAAVDRGVRRGVLAYDSNLDLILKA